ncbi:carboxypeptidase-like regulatory domain-containing protein, partial [Psychroserpens sp.]|uniref:carboxypeptidase-like regulatory domain-containing protein n=1 Tax=Psychroserpens sp. TaxID=2020870 RepID=UPI003C77CA70
MKHIYVCIMLFLSCYSYAQITITGTITSAEDGQPLAYVNISNNVNQGTISDENGRYEIEVSSTSNELKFSYLGYKTQTVIVGDNTIINILLEEDTAALDEVVITALGLERESKELGYVVQELNSETLTEVKTVNFLDNIAG